MILTAYAQATPAQELHIWVGVFGAAMPPAPGTITFLVNDTPVQPASGALQPIRDGQAESGAPANHRGVFVLKPALADFYRIEVQASGAPPVKFSTTMLPPDLPATMDGAFNILLSSCYYRPRDGGGLATAIASIKHKPNLTLLAGDQVYGDLPLTPGPPRSPLEIRTELGNKYRINWASQGLGTPGLGEILAQAPVICVPDDHEYWNNYPFRQAQLADSYWPSSRKGWDEAARDLYEDYQVSQASSSGATRLDIGPLKMLFLDMRSDRDDEYERLMGAPAWAGFDQWVQDLIASPDGVGLLSSGQALLMQKPNDLAKHMADAEMPNYAEFDRLCDGLAKLADARVPILYVTGDVHWGRISEVQDLPSGHMLLHEVIASPSMLIDSPLDFFTLAKKKLFDSGNPWPRHSEADPVPEKFGPHGRFKPERTHTVVGDQVAVLAFSRDGGGVVCNVIYYNISTSPTLSKPQPRRVISLKRL